MKKIELEKDLYQYQFSPFENQHYGFNIYALINKNEALLIDTAFEQHAETVLQDLQKDGIEVKHVVFSHFHPDHTSGLPILNSPKLYGNKLYKESLNKYTSSDKHHYFDGLNTLNEDSELSFGQFQMRFNLIQGHAICGMFTIINEKFIHAADDIMTSNTGKPLLPSVHIKSARKHIDSLELLKQYTSYTLLPSHGNILIGESDILKAIEHRQNYLKAIVSSNEPISIEKALENCECDFLHREWHGYVYN